MHSHRTALCSLCKAVSWSRQLSIHTFFAMRPSNIRSALSGTANSAVGASIVDGVWIGEL